MLRVDQTLLQQVILSRHSDSYKGDYGRLLLIGGTYPYGGAIIMAASQRFIVERALSRLRQTARISLPSIVSYLKPWLCCDGPRIIG